MSFLFVHTHAQRQLNGMSNNATSIARELILTDS